MLKIPGLFPRHYHACAQSLPDLQRVDPQAQVCWKEDMFKQYVELSDHQDFLRFGRNLDRKIALRQAKKTLVASVHGTIALQPELDFLQVQNFKKEGSASFPTVPRTSKTDIGS